MIFGGGEFRTTIREAHPPDFGHLQRNPMDSKHLVNLLHEQFFFPGTSQQPIFCQTPQLEIFQIVQSTPLKQESNKACFIEMKNHGPDCWFVPQLLRHGSDQT